MFFVVSKTAGKLIYPGTLVLILLLVGAVALALGRLVPNYRRGLYRLGMALPILVAVAWGLATLGQLGDRLLLDLEQRYAVPAAVELPQANELAGIIVLGGGINALVSRHVGRATLGDSGDRLAAGLALARRYKRVPLVYTGGSGRLGGGPRGADYAAEWFTAMGLPARRLVLERQSRNTYENAVATRELVGEARDGRWLLVTSARHMPRAMGSFAAAGWQDLVAYPVGHKVAGQPTGLGASPAKTLRRLDIVVHEHVGRWVYRLTGRWAVPGPSGD